MLSDCCLSLVSMFKNNIISLFLSSWFINEGLIITWFHQIFSKDAHVCWKSGESWISLDFKKKCKNYFNGDPVINWSSENLQKLWHWFESKYYSQLIGTVRFTATYLKFVSSLDFSLTATWAGHWLLGRPKQLKREKSRAESQQQILPTTNKCPY